MKIGKKQGFTLAEVVIGLLVFAVLATTSSVAFVQTQKLAHANVMHNTARTVIQGYIEQIKGVQYYKLLEAMEDPANIPLPTKSISSLSEAGQLDADIQIADLLYLNTENEKEVLLDIVDQGNGVYDEHTMKLTVIPTATNILSTEGREVLEFTLNYSYESLFKGMQSSHTGTVRFIKTSVSEF